MSGCSRFIEGQNVISAKIVPKKWTGEKMNFSYKQEYLKKKQKKNILL